MPSETAESLQLRTSQCQIQFITDQVSYHAAELFLGRKMLATSSVRPEDCIRLIGVSLYPEANIKIGPVSLSTIIRGSRLKIVQLYIV